MTGSAWPGDGPRPVGSRYRAEQRIGHGGMGEVWRGHDHHSGAPIAIKFLRADLVARDQFVARFLREARILKGLHDPRLVGVIDFVAEGGSLAIVMDLVEGPDLRTVLAAAGTPHADEAVALIDEVLLGLAVVHQGGVVHGDVKPANLLLPADQQPLVRIADFGIAKVVEDAATGESASEVIGSPDYMAPELTTGEQPTRASDLYAVGIVAYELLAGQPPFHGGQAMSVLYRHLHENPVRPDAVSDPLWQWVTIMLAKDPAARPSDALTALAMLRSATADSTTTRTILPGHVPPSVTWEPNASERSGSTRVLHSPSSPPMPAPPTQPSARPSRGSRLLTVLVGVLALAVVIQGILLARGVGSGDRAAPTAPTPTVSPGEPGVRRTSPTVPSVIGMHVSSGVATLESYGYAVQIRETLDDSRADGEIVAQDPGAGGQPSGGTVVIQVSRRSAVVWLADLSPIEGYAQAGTVDLADRSYARGVRLGEVCSEPTAVTYDVGRNFSALTTVLAVDGLPEGTGVAYRILVDGTETSSGQVTPEGPQSVWVDLHGRATLTIETRTYAATGCGPGVALLGDPRLIGMAR